jgi:hypothetical protein
VRQVLIVFALFFAALTPFVVAPHLGPPTYHVRGELLTVTPLARDEAQAVTVRADDGQVLAFRVHPQVELTLGELEDLQRRERPVDVQYRIDGEELIALDILPSGR